MFQSNVPGEIPLGEVPLHATEALDFLRSIKTYELPNPEIEAIERSLPEAIAQIGPELARTMAMLEDHPALFALQVIQEHWRELPEKIGLSWAWPPLG